MLVGNLKKKYAQAVLAEKPPLQETTTTTTDSEMEDPYLQGGSGDSEHVQNASPMSLEGLGGGEGQAGEEKSLFYRLRDGRGRS